jgi:exopolysaccharide biosynthesis protein
LGERIEAKVNLTFFDPPSKTEVLGNDYPNWTQVIFCKDTVLRFYDPKKVGDISPWEKDCIWSVPLSYTLLEDGKVSIRNICYFKDHYNMPNPRTIIGQRQNLNMLLIVVQGRRLGQRGMTALQEAELCHELGLWNAVNADGGGSSEMIVVENGKQIIKNKPTDGHERPIGTGLVIYGK